MIFAMRILFAALFYSILLSGYAAASETFKGTCARVVDGDTIHVAVWRFDPDTRKWDQETRIVRLEGIDAPEIDQRGGLEAKWFLTKLINGDRVEVQSFGKDWHGRIIGRVQLIERSVIHPLDTSFAMLATGNAWWYRKYAPKNNMLKEIEEYAQSKKVGIWRESNPTPPWVFRKQKNRVHDRHPRSGSGTVDS